MSGLNPSSVIPLSGSLGLGQSHPHWSHGGVGPLNVIVSSSWTLVITLGGQPFTMLYVSPVAPGAVLPL